MISIKTHGYMDYAMGILLIVIPFLWTFPNETASAIFIWLGVGTILYSLLTNYELGLFKVIPMKVHLFIDVFGGLFLLASPWLFGFSDEIFLPFVILGAVEILAGFMTKREPHFEKNTP